MPDVTEKLERTGGKRYWKERYEEKIEKYNSIIQKKSNLISSISNSRVKIQSLDNDISNLNSSLVDLEREYDDLVRRFEGQDKDSDTSGVARLLDAKKCKLKEKNEDNLKIVRFNLSQNGYDSKTWNNKDSWAKETS